MKTDNNDRMMNFSRYFSLVTLILVSITSQAISQSLQSVGRIESRVGLIPLSEISEENQLVHMERIDWGVQQQFDFLEMNYRLSAGGVIRGSSQIETVQFTPEFQGRFQISPFRQVALEMFSYSQLRNPMQIAQDSLQHQEQVSGLQLRSRLPGDGSISIAYGVRNASRDTSETDHQFMKLQLDQKLLGLQFRFRGEKDFYTTSASSGEDDRSNMSIQWYGSPIKGLNWTALNSVYNYNGVDYWRIYQRVNYQLTRRSTVWAHVRNQQVAYRGSYLNTQGFDFDYRWKLNDEFALQILSEGEKVKPLSGDPLHHWRAYMTGLHWRIGDQRSALGVLQVGYKETYQFGAGMDLRYEVEERLPLLQSRLLRVGIRDYSEGEYFVRMDGVEEDPRYDIDHKLDLNIDLWPGQKVQIGNTFRLLNHFGTDLDFSEDTLRNAVTHNIQFKYVKRKLRTSIDHYTINDLGDESDLRLHLNARLTYHMTPGSSLNFISMYRYQSDKYPDYIWLNSFLKLNMHYFNWALEVQAQGSPDTLFDEQFSVWMRFVRQI